VKVVGDDSRYQLQVFTFWNKGWPVPVRPEECTQNTEQYDDYQNRGEEEMHPAHHGHEESTHIAQEGTVDVESGDDQNPDRRHPEFVEDAICQWMTQRFSM
jgi:hypothetical protein